MVTHAQKKIDVQESYATAPAPRRGRFLPLIMFFAIFCVTFFLFALLPLRGLYFYLSFPNTAFGSWLLWPTHLLFPGKPTWLTIHTPYRVPAPQALAWQETGLLFAGFAAIFALYLLAIRLLPQRVTQQYILTSTAILGLLCVLFPAMPSQDTFSYIAYARMGVIYHLNPLVALPTAIAKDPVYPYVFWIHQPSIYGPTWTIITCVMQWAALAIGLKSILTMTLLLRLFGLAMHLASTQLIWVLIGSLQRLTGRISLKTRLLATLAFAWNPLLLLEACISGHNDATMLVLILLALWFLLPRQENKAQSYIIAAVLLAMATSLKVTIVVFFPLLLLYLWKQQTHGLYSLRDIRNLRSLRSLCQIQGAAIAFGAYVGITILLYAPFWQHGAAMYVIKINPGTLRDINSPYEFLTHFYESIRHRAFMGLSPDKGTSIEKLTHLGSFALFSILYGLYCLRILMIRRELSTLSSLIRTMALAWLVYCFIGSPWLWPWYFITFFGLYALIETVDTPWLPLSNVLRLPLAMRLLTFALLSLYCFDTWAPITAYVPALYAFRLTYMRGLWICVVPLLAVRFPLPAWLAHKQSSRQTQEILQLPVIADSQQDVQGVMNYARTLQRWGESVGGKWGEDDGR